MKDALLLLVLVLALASFRVTAVAPDPTAGEQPERATAGDPRSTARQAGRAAPPSSEWTLTDDGLPVLVIFDGEEAVDVERVHRFEPVRLLRSPRPVRENTSG